MAALTVIGIGSRLRGDDAIGPLLIDALKERGIPDLELVDAGSDALGILEYVQDRERVLIVDACAMGLSPGSVEIIQASRIKDVLQDDPMSLHGLGLAEAIQMGTSLQMLPENLKIIGIEPESIQFNGSLSAPVKRALKRLVQMVQDELDRSRNPVETWF